MDEGLKSLKNLLPVTKKSASEIDGETSSSIDVPKLPLKQSDGLASSMASSSSTVRRAPARPEDERKSSLLDALKKDMLGTPKLDNLVRQTSKHGSATKAPDAASKDGALPTIDGFARLKAESRKSNQDHNESKNESKSVDRVLSKMSLGKSDDQAVSLPSVHNGWQQTLSMQRQRTGLGNGGRLGSGRGNRNQSLFRNVSSAGSAGSKDGRTGSASGSRPFSKNARRVRHDQAMPAFCDPAEILKSCSLFKNCSVAFIRSLQELSGEAAQSGKMLEPRTPVVTEGTLGESMFIIERGQCQMTQGSTAGRVLGPGDFFGERVLLGLDSRHTASVRALTMCQLLEVSCVAFMQTLMRHPIERHQFERGREQAGKQAQSGKRKHKKQVSDEAPTSPSSTLTLNVIPASPASPSNRSHVAFEGGNFPRGFGMPTGQTGSATVSRLRPSVAAHKSQEPRRSDEKTPEASGSSSPKGDKRPASSAKPETADKSPSASLRSKKYGVGVVDMRGTEAEDESFIERVKRSLKVDVHRGFRMPGMACLEAYSEHLFEGKADNGGRLKQHEDVRIEIGLLPPLSTMTPLQKKGLQRQLEDRLSVRRRLRKAAKRFTTLRGVGFTGKFGDLATQMQEKAAAE